MVQRLLGILDKEEKKRLAGIFILAVVVATLEVGSVASIMPFLEVASEPDSINNNKYLSWAYEVGGFQSSRGFLAFLGLLCVVFLTISNASIIYIRWVRLKFVWDINHSISVRLLQTYLRQPYKFFIINNTSDLSKNILQETREVAANQLNPLISAGAKLTMAVAIFGFITYLNPIVAVVMTLVLGGSYLVIYLAVKQKLATIGERRVNQNERRYTHVSEVLSGIKAIKTRGEEKGFLDKFKKSSSKYSYYQALHGIINGAPRYILEAIAFGGVILIAVYLLFSGGNMASIVPTLGVYVFAGYRLMPALQNAFKGIAKAKYNQEALNVISDVIDSKNSNKRSDNVARFNVKKGYSEKPLIRLEDVSYGYPGSENLALKSISLTFEQGIYGIVGQTGSGKSTLIDIMLGLIKPTKGKVIIKGFGIDNPNVRNWQQAVGYVPQNIYLTDHTIRNNVALGVPEKEINDEEVVRSLRAAQIYDFVENETHKGLSTNVGERGVKLSGGQMQRIGIARALYHSPSVLFFDEATSALDPSTEQDLINAVSTRPETTLLVLVSHSLDTMSKTDSVISIENGVVSNQGRYAEIINASSSFQGIAT
ncbi:ATP-binding cassette subfamily C protein [Salinibacter ruber]|uniref:ABC transporter ATP-binding protein n=1 Tax=Salinibacter ruber TaxID=146919 RepID=UPI002169FFE1|nr:ABC transporter ATP-binding protein [Salinibacter ruber]MCS3753182.1 ATP-binding cassette subfamily C protein [Salinibacter ruber]